MNGQERPQNLTVNRQEETLEILWTDGHRSLYQLAGLRNTCPCGSENRGQPVERAAAPVVIMEGRDSHLLEDSFRRKNNEEAKGWSDILALYDVLHDEKRVSDPKAWRADLEAIFDVDGFLEWLGIAAFVGHGDT